jgi:hypothetical protein
MLDLRLRSVDYQQANLESLLNDMGGDYNRYRTESLLKQRSLAESGKTGLYKLMSNLVSTEQRERVRYINERGVAALRLKTRQ